MGKACAVHATDSFEIKQYLIMSLIQQVGDQLAERGTFFPEDNLAADIHYDDGTYVSGCCCHFHSRTTDNNRCLVGRPIRAVRIF